MADFYSSSVHARLYGDPEDALYWCRRRIAAEFGRCKLDLGILKDAHVLDVGAGIQGLVMAEHGANVTHVDIDEGCIAQASKISRERKLSITHRQCDLVKSVPAKNVNLAYVHGVLHHTGDWKKALRSVLSSLASGGTAIIICYRKENRGRATVGVARELLKDVKVTEELVRDLATRLFDSPPWDIADIVDDFCTPIWTAISPKEFRAECESIGYSCDVVDEKNVHDENFRAVVRKR